jgi:hypothetical protein
MKTVRLSESQLVELINRVVNENQLVGGVQGMSPMPEATATEEPKKETKPKAEKPVAQKLYDSLAKAKGEFEKHYHNIDYSKNPTIKTKYTNLIKAVEALHVELGKHPQVNKL